MPKYTGKNAEGYKMIGVVGWKTGSKGNSPFCVDFGKNTE